MTKRFKVLCMVVLSLIIGTSTVSAYNGEKKNVTVVALDVNDVFQTSTETVGEFLTEIGVTTGEADYISKGKDQQLLDNDVITVRKAVPVVLKVDGSPRIIYTSREKVVEVIKDHKADFGKNFRLDADLKENTLITEKMTIGIITQKETTVTEVITTPFAVKKIENPELTKGFEKITQPGVNGESKVTLKNLYEGTTLVSSKEIGKVLIADSVDQIVEIGTKEVDSVEGYTYTDAIEVSATGYTRFDAGCDDWTATGTLARKGVVAVDPKVFPYGTKFYIPGYGIGVAEDCGGAIKGNKIDLCYDTLDEAFAWGRRNVTIYVIE